MKLLFDENLSPKLVRILADVYPDSAHVYEVGLGTTDDRIIRAWAADGGYTMVTKDAGFYQRALQVGHPPKVIWIRSGNRATRHTAALLRDHQHAILDFGDDPDTSVLLLG